MRRVRLIRLVAMGLLSLQALSFTAEAGCGVEWRLPKDHFDGVNEYGYVSYWEQIGELDLQDGLKIPLVIGFESNRESTSPYLGQGWILALLDSRIVQTNERDFQMILPNGYSLSFGRDGKNPNILNGQAGWKAEIKADTITAYASCGWKLLFSKGKLAAITTPKNRVFDYVFNGGRVSEIREKGATVLRVEINAATGAIAGISYGPQRIGIEQGPKPQVQSIKGQNLVAGMQTSLRQVTFPDGHKESYEFAVNEKVQPTLTVSGALPRTITWDPATKRIVKDGVWTYDIKPSEVAWENAAIGRTNEEGQREFWHYDGARGFEVLQLQNGPPLTRRWFTSGLLAGKQRSAEVMNNGKVVTRRFSYDAKARLLRETEGNITKEYIEGRLVRFLSNGVPLLELVYSSPHE